MKGQNKNLALLTGTALALLAVVFGIGRVKAATQYTIPDSIVSDCSVDVTTDIQNWVASIPDDSTLLFKQNACYNIDGGLVFNKRNNLTFDGNGSTFKVFSKGGSHRSDWTFHSGSNITLKNLTSYGANAAGGEKGVYDTTVEWQHAYDLEGVDTATLDNVQGYNVYGDFVEALYDTTLNTNTHIPAKNITVTNSHFERNGRMGVGATDVDGFVFKNNYLGDIRQDGLDFEMEVPDAMAKNIVVQGNTFALMNFAVVSISGGGPNQVVQNFNFSNNNEITPPNTCISAIYIVDNTGNPGWTNFVFDNNSLNSLHYVFQVTGIYDASFTNNNLELTGRCSAMGAVQLTGVTNATIDGNTYMGYDPATVIATDSTSTGVVIGTNTNLPLEISNVQVKTITKNSATITWDTNYISKSQVWYGLTTKYNVANFLDVNLVTHHTAVISNLTPNTLYNFKAESTTVSNVVTDSTNYTLTTAQNVADTTLPTVTLDASLSGTTVSGPLVLSATASDDTGVVGVQFKIDGINQGAEITAAPYQLSVDTATLSDGTHVLTAVTYDAAGNMATSSPINILVNNTDVTPPVTTPPATGGESTPPPVGVPAVPPSTGGGGGSPSPITIPPVMGGDGSVPFVPSNSLTPMPYPSGTLVNDQGTIYLIRGSYKIGFTSAAAFLGLGYKFSDVVNGSTAGISVVPGYLISSSNQEHPWGTWLLYRGTVYYSTQAGMIGVPSVSVLQNNKGSLAKLFFANDADINLIRGSNQQVMSSTDPRVIY